MPLGAHMSIAGGMDKAILRGQSIGCETIQVFTKSSNRWRAKPLVSEEIARFKQAREESGINPVFGHTSYLINLGSPDEDLWQKSVDSFLVEMERCAALGLPYLVMHPGAHMGAGEDVGLRRIGRALDEILARTEGSGVIILLETTAGQGSNIGYRFEHLARLIEESAYPDRLGVCFDTCHAFAAGYDLRTPEAFHRTFEEFDALIGIDRLKAIHLNDSRGDLGSRIDRHEHIGLGKLGLEPFRLLLNDPRFRNLPMVLETPKGPDMKEDVMNLATLRSLIE
ncbi:MAG: putative endonuclease 4 [Clostridia bacterium 62_21]|nr:MAG: putative endonuclease 4 [Clostridia bacterium 62_21]HAG07776.1 deoxyribonuclease IV [Peptococcaceae bacterium]